MKPIQRLALAILWLLAMSGTSAYAQVHADFTADKTSSCSPLLVRFTDQSTGNITSWKWSLGNGNVSTQKNPGAIYLTPGYKTITLIVSDGVTSDTITKTNYLQVFKNPEANFVASAVTGCAPTEICFLDSTIVGDAPISSWIWDFGDGHSSTAPQPCNTYAQGGSYSVTLITKDLNGCESQKTVTNLINISSKINADFTSNIQSACNPPLSVQFTNLTQSSLPLSYQWNFGNATSSSSTNPSVSYSSAGVYDVSLIIRNSMGCRDTILKPGFIAIEDLVTNFTSDVTNGCVGAPIQFTDLSTSNPNIWHWDFGDGTTDTVENPLHSYAAAGTYTVSLFSANSSSCADSVTYTSYITVSPSPIANFGGSNLLSCNVPLTVQFYDSSLNAVSWFWDFGDSTTSTLQNPSHTYISLDTFDVTLTVMNVDSCVSSFTIPSMVKIAAPEAIIHADTTRGCSPLLVNFTSDSSISNSPVVGWFWSFGDGQISTQQNPSHVFTQDSIYDITLIIFNAEGCTDTVVRNSYIRAGSKPTGEYTSTDTSICLYSPIVFTDLSSNNANEWFWDFGDGGTALDQDPTYSYSDTGYFDVRLIVGHNGCRDTIIKQDYVYISPPDARFTVARNCANPYTVSFIDNSLAPDTWFWSFGDGTTSNSQNTVHTFAARGTYAPTLTVEDTVNQCFDVEALSIRITDPVSNFSADAVTGCRPFTTTFRDSSIDAASYAWRVGTLTSNLRNPTFTFTVPGVYDARLIITDANGCRDTLFRPAYITVLGPTANYAGDPTTGCAPLPVQFGDSSTAFMSPIVRWSWTFGDGDSSTAQNPSHVYDSIGSYRVGLTVTDANGCAHTIQRSNYIRPTFPRPAFTGDTLSCVGAPTNFTNTSIGSTLTFLWNFGDGDTSTLSNPTHIYTQEGTYSVSLTAYDLNGCDSTFTRTSYVVVQNPSADFTADSTSVPCPPLLVNFTDLSSNDIVAWEWHFGDNSNVSNLKNPSHLYLTPGNFTVTLITTNSKGCQDTTVKADFVVVLGPNGNFTFTPRNACINNEVFFTATTTNTAVRTWDFGDGIVQNAGDSVLHTYANYGVYNPVLILDDGLGCIVPLSSTDSLVVGYISSDFAANKNYHCFNGTVAFADSSIALPAITSWKWFFGDGDSSTAQNPTHYYAGPGVYDVMLITTNGNCVDTLLKPNYIVIDEGPLPSFDLSVISGCVPQLVSITNTTPAPGNMASWNWSFGNGSTDTVQNPFDQTYTAVGNYTIQLIATSLSGCIDTATKVLPVHALPFVSAGNDTFVCFNDSVGLLASGAVSYQWSPSAGLSSTSVANPMAGPGLDIDYVVLGTDSNGCQSRDTVSVVVNPLPKGSITEDLAVCIGESVELEAGGGTKYEWSPVATLNCDSCALVISTPLATTIYQVTITNQFKCTNVQDVTVMVNPYPTGVMSSVESICFGESITLESIGGTTQVWGPAAMLDCDTCAIVTATPNITTTYSVAVTNQYNCTVEDTVLVNVNPLPVVAVVGRTDICRGETIELVASGGATYSWTPATELTCDDCANPSLQPDSSDIYKVVATTAFGCMDSTTHTVNVHDIPSVSTIDDVTLCEGDNIVLASSESLAARVEWSPALYLDDSSSLSPTLTPKATTTYTITVVTDQGCTASDNVAVTVINKVMVSLDAFRELCYGESVQLNVDILQAGNQGVNYVWNPINFFNEQNTPNPILTPDTTRTYTLIAYSGSCIPDTQNVTVVVNPLPVLAEVEARNVVEGTPMSLNIPVLVGSANTYSWTPSYNLSCSDCERPSLVANQTENYSLLITDEKGCQDESTITINVIGRCGDDIFVPNTFTPNRDGNNDVLRVRGLTDNGLKIFRVFDRWGNLVYESNDINEGWNGIYNGKLLDPGVFVYYFEAVCTNGLSVTRQGNVTLMK